MTRTNNGEVLPWPPQPVMQFSRRDMRKFVARAIGELSPAVVKQLIRTDLGFPINRFRAEIMDLVKKNCKHFIRHARKWVPNPEENILQLMLDYPWLWEGYACDEPYHACTGKPIKYFMDFNRQQRLREADAMFVVMNP